MSKWLLLVPMLMLAAGCYPIPDDFPALMNTGKHCTHIVGTAGQVNDFDAHATNGYRCESGDESYCWIQVTEPAIEIHFPKAEVGSCECTDPEAKTCGACYELCEVRADCGSAQVEIVGTQDGYLWGTFSGELCEEDGTTLDIEGKFSTFSQP